jgi:hypothetical protein
LEDSSRCFYKSYRPMCTLKPIDKKIGILT